MPSALQCCSGAGSADQVQSSVIFQNFDCHRRFGTPRPASACNEYVASLAASDRKARQDLELAIIRVSATPDMCIRATCVNLYQIHSTLLPSAPTPTSLLTNTAVLNVMASQRTSLC